MADAQSALSDLLNLLGTSNPLGAVTKNLDGMKKGVESLVTAVQAFTRTMESLEVATKRVTALLDEIEAPLRSVTSQLATLPPDALPKAVASINSLSTQLSQLATPLSGVAGLAGAFLGNLRPTTVTDTTPAAAGGEEKPVKSDTAGKPAAKRRAGARSKKDT